jgi:arginine decarboxylase
VDETEAVGSHVLLDNLLEIYHAPLKGNIQECYHDAIFYIDKIRSLFLHGSISLRKRAMGENIFWRIMMRIMKELRELDYVPEELQEVEASMADIYYGNFSVFQSLPDAWAINQLFPIMPIHRLSEFPTRNATLSDITCDSDGKISRFTDLKDVRKMLPIHELNGKEYYLGVFLVGAYQETLGDLHNLLGDPNVIGVQLDKDGQLEFTHEIRGDSVADVLFYMEYDPKDLGNRVRIMAEDAVRKGLISPLERKSILECYNAGLQGYTYYERNIKEQKVETSPGPVESHR